MSDNLSLKDALYPIASPAGAYYAVSSPEQDAARVLLTQILRLGHSVPLTEALLAEWSNNDLDAGWRRCTGCKGWTLSTARKSRVLRWR
jgi:hypothetical protein